MTSAPPLLTSPMKLVSAGFETERNVSAALCIEPWIYLRVSSEGEVKLCCYSEEVLGNLNYEKMADLCNGEKYRYFRRKVNSDDLPEDCKKCPKKLGMTV